MALLRESALVENSKWAQMRKSALAVIAYGDLVGGTD
jgi:hypothetical protein